MQKRENIARLVLPCIVLIYTSRSDDVYTSRNALRGSDISRRSAKKQCQGTMGQAWMMKGVRCMNGRRSTRMLSSSADRPAMISICSPSRTLSGNGSSFSSSRWRSACGSQLALNPNP